MFRQLRISVLLIILLVVALTTWQTKIRTTDWDSPLWMVVYPINADGSKVSDSYIQSLSESRFDPIERFLKREAKLYGVSIDQPLTIKLAPQLEALPPTPPESRNPLLVAWWSLKMRYWALTHNNYEGPSPDIQMFVLYHDPSKQKQLAHSLGLEKGLIGVVNAYAGKRMAAQNNIVIAHEMLHTVGATDKYDLATNRPVFPIGYADPNRAPLHPQAKAEIMAGRVALSESKAVMPRGLKSVIVGETTASEINWK